MNKQKPSKSGNSVRKAELEKKQSLEDQEAFIEELQELVRQGKIQKVD